MLVINSKPVLLASDLEGVLIPEIWIAVADTLSIDELRLTTRDISDYDELMSHRLGLLREHKIQIGDVQSIIATMDPLPGAAEFLGWARTQMQVVIITDSYYEFVSPFLPKLNFPTIFAHTLKIEQEAIVGYKLRTQNGKQHSVAPFSDLGFYTISVGDSYNDIGMLTNTNSGIFFCPSPTIAEQFPEIPVTYTYNGLQSHLCNLV